MIKISPVMSQEGIATAGSPFAASIGAKILEGGGNAADAAVGMALAMAVADPANCSLFGRCHILIRNADGMTSAIDGATQAPTATPPLLSGEHRGGYQAAPIPGLPRALEKLHRRHGRLPLVQVAAPAAALAETGFAPPPHLTSVWRGQAGRLAETAPAASLYLSPNHLPPDLMRHQKLANLIRAFGTDGGDAIMAGDGGHRLAQSICGMGGYWSADDLQSYEAQDGEVVQGRFRDCEIITIGRQGWGHTLIELLSILDRMDPFGPSLTVEEGECLLLAIGCALSDRPQMIGSLTPKPTGLAYETLIDPAFIDERAALIRGYLDSPDPADFLVDLPYPKGLQDRDTTHLSVMDRDGASVAMTCSIGPHFGAGVIDPEHGVLLAHSYRMVSNPTASARDVTEMAPVMVTRNGQLILSLGAAGSERIPGAIAQVIVNTLDRGLGLADAVAFPRINIKAGRVRMHADADIIIMGLRGRGYDVGVSERGHENHLGIVQAAGLNKDGQFEGVADPAWDGSAVGVQQASC